MNKKNCHETVFKCLGTILKNNLLNRYSGLFVLTQMIDFKSIIKESTESYFTLINLNFGQKSNQIQRFKETIIFHR